MSAAKRDALIDLLPRWSLPNPLTTPLTESSLRATFGRSAPRLLDIGVGTGEATLAWAIDNPDHDVVAVELHRPGIARMLQVLESEGPPNVRIVETDAVRLLDALTNPASTTAGGVAPSPQATEPTAGTSTCPPPPPGASATHGDATATSHDPAVGTAGASHDLPRFDLPRFDGVRVLFPDPWPKARHRSRRLVDRRFVATVADLLPDGGWLHLATDWDGYALQMVRALLAEPRFEVDADPGALAEVVDPDHGLDERQVVDRGATFPTPADATEGRWDGDRISWSSARYCFPSASWASSSTGRT